MATVHTKGIAVCGNVLVDKINHIAAYPQSGELTKILRLDKSVGGCVPNVSIDLKKICPSLPVRVIGRIGADDNGDYAKKVLASHNLDLTGLQVMEDIPTSFTEVMSVAGGQRTFFTYAGADGELCAEDLDFETAPPYLLHLGYFLLLKQVDAGEGLRILKKASDAGVLTSIDLVSENSDRYELVLPCLPYTDFLIVNELEAGKLAGIDPNPDRLKDIAQKLKSMGVRQKVIIHMPELSICCSESGITVVPSYDFPAERIVGATGAGDAFCAGALYSICCGKSDREILEFASSAAVMALCSADATGGLTEENQIIAYCNQFRRKEICL